jgi:hypothetical protein
VLLSVLALMGLFRIGKVFGSLLIIAVLLFRLSIYYSLYVFVKFFVLGIVMLLLAL